MSNSSIRIPDFEEIENPKEARVYKEFWCGMFRSHQNTKYSSEIEKIAGKAVKQSHVTDMKYKFKSS